ncbi:NAD-dependent epimerase/dehydratase family protein [candidate division WOR-3 bacterium]|nr:NAD-dependent epimerase/dehydratase family protein [candidate division WOR-3 bacterium]
MKILVIGSAGFIGQFLVKNLVEKKHEVVGLDINPGPEELGKLCTYLVGDMLSPEDIIQAAQGVDLIITLAAKHHDFGVTRKEFFKVNETGTQILLDSATKSGVKKLIFYSTVAVYGTQKDPSTESMPPEPDNNYGESKLAAEKVIQKWTDEDNSRCVIIIRPTVIFGPNNYANVYNLIDKIYKKKFIFVGKGDNIKSVAYVENLVDANIFLIDKLKPGIQIFNYSDEPQMNTSQIVDVISTHLPYGAPKIKLPLFLAVSLGSIFDLLAKITGRNLPITAARMKKFATATHHKSDKIRHLGFKQQIEIKEGLRRMVEWYLANEINK